MFSLLAHVVACVFWLVSCWHCCWVTRLGSTCIKECQHIQNKFSLILQMLLLPSKPAGGCEAPKRRVRQLSGVQDTVSLKSFTSHSLPVGAGAMTKPGKQFHSDSFTARSDTFLSAVLFHYWDCLHRVIKQLLAVVIMTRIAIRNGLFCYLKV